MRHFFRFGLLWVGLGGVFALGQAPAAGPQATTIVEPPAPLLNEQFNGLPEVSGARGLAAEAGPATIDGKDCSPYVSAPAAPTGPDSGNCLALLKEDGLRRFDSAIYHHASGGQTFTVFAMEFNDATDALSAYTFYRLQMHGVRVTGAEARAGKGASEMSSDAGSYLVWSGTSVMRVMGHVSTEELIGLTAGLPKVGGRRGLAPLVPTLLPGPGLDATSMHYAVGPAGYRAMDGVLPADVLGWDKSVEVATANYAGKAGKGTLTLLMYPTPQIAGDRLRAIQQAVDAAQNKTLGTIVLRRVGPLVGVTTGGWTEAQAKELLGSLRLNQEVSFDKKMPLEFHAEIRKTASLLQNIAVFSGVLIVAAILLGLFLGAGRAGLRRLQGKPAYIEPEFLTISLRESETEHFEKIREREL